jgi:predicted nucleic acid-binding protein
VLDLEQRFNIIDFTIKDIEAALVETGADIEDNIQFVLAKKLKCYIVVTNNYKDYRFLQGIEVLRPAKIRQIPK